MDEREMGSQPPVIILDHFSFTLTFVSWVGRGSFPALPLALRWSLLGSLRQQAAVFITLFSQQPETWQVHRQGAGGGWRTTK